MLLVALLGEKDDLDAVDALLLLKHFRGVSDFVPAVQEEQVPGQRVFLGTLKTGSGDYARANEVFGAKSGREKALN